MSRTLRGVLGTVVVLAALAAGTGPAGATDTDAEQPEPRARMVEETGAKATSPPTLAPHRSIYSKVVYRDGRLLLRGDVENWFGRRVVVQRKACSGCDWHRHDVVLTGDRGWFTSVIGAPRRGSTFWRARVAAADGYSRAYSATWETYY